MRKISYKILAILTATVGGKVAQKMTTKARARMDPDLDPTSREARWVPVLAAAG